MKKSKITVLAAMSAVFMAFCSCTAELLERMEPSAETPATSKMNLRISKNADTRSSISPDEGLIEDICVMAYSQKDGRLADIQTKGSAEEIELEMPSGTYNIYVTANMGTFDAPINEADIKQAFYSIGSVSHMGRALPMSWQGRTELKAGEKTTVYAKLSRLVSKVGFKVEMGVLDGLEITSARLCQAAGRIRPFMDGGSRILTPDEAVDGDYATEEDLENLMQGETMYFYVAENCQGTLLPDNDDPWTKVPDNIGESAELCTYVEMEGQWLEDADYEGQVTYRFFLGEDASKSFDIRRNSLHNLTLYLEEESFEKISWKIDASQMEATAWEVYPTLYNNFHEKDDFYVTENICLDFSFDEKGQKYWKKRNNAFSLAGVDYDGNVLIRFNQIRDLGKGNFRAIGTCIKDGDYDILLINSATDEIEYVMESGTVRIPDIVAGEDGEFSDNLVEGFDEESEFFINGESVEICLYLTDREGYNLNQGHYYGCDFSICQWDTEILNSAYGHDLFENASVETIEGGSGSDGYALCYRISIENDGADKEWNRMLTQSLGSGLLQLKFTETASGASGSHPAALYAQDIGITFKPVPDSRKATFGTEFMYAVSNPSNIPLKIRGIKLNAMDRVPHYQELSPVLCDDIPWHTNTVPLLVSKMPYTICSMEDDSSVSSVIDGKTCYPAYDNGISQGDIPDQMAMFHNLEVSYVHSADAYMSGIFGYTDFYDTPAHTALYGKDGYQNCGVIMHLNEQQINVFDQNNGLNTDFRQYGDIMTKEYIGKFHDIIEVDLGINENNELTAKASRDAELNISVTGFVRGHIRCVSVQDPFNTIWGHYFSHREDFSSNMTVSVGSSPKAVDNGTITDAFEQLRAEEYYSVIDAWKVEEFRTPRYQQGSFREYLKPEYIYLTIGITSTDGTPVAVSFSGSVKYDYRTSAPVTWPTGSGKVAMVPSSYSGFDDRLIDDGCPEGSIFKAEVVDMEPYVSFANDQGIYYK